MAILLQEVTVKVKRTVLLVVLLLLGLMTVPVESFTSSTRWRRMIHPSLDARKTHSSFRNNGLKSKVSDKDHNDDDDNTNNAMENDHRFLSYGAEKDANVLLSRRQTVFRAATTIATLAGASATITPALAATAAASPPPGSTPENPVAILGGGGKTGKEVALALTKEGLYSVTMTRTGKAPTLPKVKEGNNDPSVFVTHYSNPVNVCDSTESLVQVMKDVHASAMIYCASASKQGGTAFQVDADGVANAAKAAQALDGGNTKFILISALAVSRPESKSYKMTNNLGGNYDRIMDAKRLGEDQTRSILSKSKNYVIVRPGPLLGVKSKNGSLDIEVNQGDTICGGISRDELAGVVVGALVNPNTTKKGITVEVYRTSTRTKLQPEFELQSGNEVTGSTTYAGLFDSIKAAS